MRILLPVLSLLAFLARGADHSGWREVEVPGDLEGGVPFSWLRCEVTVPASWEGSRLLLEAGRIRECDEAYFNGERIGASGSFPPDFALPASPVRRPYVIEPDQIRYGRPNLIAWRIYSRQGGGAITEGPVRLSRIRDAIDLSGRWLARSGDDPRWAALQVGAEKPGRLEGALVEVDARERLAALESVRRRFDGNASVHARIEDKGQPLDPASALDAFVLGKGLALDAVASEPQVRQPLFLDFDARGRLWVVQYLQYPDPAGLETLAWDAHLRRIYDQVPPPPPLQGRFAGRDRITFHEDLDGDGAPERHGTFVEGLSLATSLAFASGGLWVLQPPYLLFFPDSDGDDRPDGAPVVHLSGFGLEDTHSVANSLAWGPDGWLYGATGSTVTARVRSPFRPGEPPAVFLGQAVWRYHPDSHRFELFSEGGWNNFGLAFDSQGRLLSGTNGRMQAVHFRQGGFYRKNFGKHGPFTRAHTYGHLEGIPVQGSSLRMVHQWIPYPSEGIPGLQGRLVGPNPLGNRLHALRMVPHQGTFHTVEEPAPLLSRDPWFRPVHLALGPGNDLYLADWYDARITHLDPRDNWDRERGRIYRLRDVHRPPARAPDLDGLPSPALVGLLGLPDDWQRRTARRLLRERQDASVLPLLEAGLEQGGLLALECLWSIHALGRLDEATALRTLESGEGPVRRWTIRLLCDPSLPLAPSLFEAFLRRLEAETDEQVLAQAASSARRLPLPQALPLLRSLLEHGEQVGDPAYPLLCWWLLVEQIRSDPQETLEFLRDPGIWSLPLFESHLAERTGRRFMADRRQGYLDRCAILLSLAPEGRLQRALARGMELALRGIPAPQIPASLEQALEPLWKSQGGDMEMLALALALESPSGLEAAIAAVSDPALDPEGRRRLLQNLCRKGDPGALPLLLSLVQEEGSPLRSEALNGLRFYSGDRVARALLQAMARTEDRSWQQALAGVLSGRPSWAVQLQQAVEEERVALLPGVQWRLEAVQAPQSAEGRRVLRALDGGPGDAQRGEALFGALCAPCHRLFGAGRAVGPDLTGYERSNTQYLLTAIVDPGLAVREEYEWVTLILRGQDEQVTASGFLEREDESTVTLRDLSGSLLTLGRRDVAGRKRSSISAMPQGLLRDLDPGQIRDLFAFLQKPSGE